jgi:hypothetical protein
MPRDQSGALLLMCAALTTLSFLIVEIYSLDVWWQVTIGRDIMATLDVPSIDSYTAAGRGRTYHDSHWFFQVFLAAWHSMFGMIGVQLATVVLWSVTLILCHRACRLTAPAAVSTILVFLTAMASIERFLPRPEIVTFAGMAAFYLILQSRRYQSPAQLGVIALIQVAWANGHGLFVIGPFMVGAYLVREIVLRIRGIKSEIIPLTKALLVVLGATLVTPFGLGGWRYALLLFNEVGSAAPTALQTLNELSPTFGWEARSAPAFWFFAVLLVLVLVAGVVMIRRGRLTPRAFIVAAMLAAALSGRRNVVLFALVAAPFVAEELGAILPEGWRPPLVAAVAVAAAMLAWAAYPLSGAYYLRMEIPARCGLGATPSFFPHALPDRLAEIHYDGQVLNSNGLGGFYLYHSYPERLPLWDGRWEVYDSKVLDDLLAGSRGSGSWRRLVKRFAIDGILLAHTSLEARAMVPALIDAPDWRLVYVDQAASFWLAEEWPGGPPRVDLDDSASLPDIVRPDDGFILSAFLDLAGADELQLAALKKTLEFGRRREIILTRLGELELRTGRMADAERTYAMLVDLQPDNAVALNELAFLAFSRGDLEIAESMLERALAVDPDNRDYRVNLDRVREAARQKPRTGEESK